MSDSMCTLHKALHQLISFKKIVVSKKKVFQRLKRTHIPDLLSLATLNCLINVSKTKQMTSSSRSPGNDIKFNTRKEHELREPNGILLKSIKRRERNKQQRTRHKNNFLEAFRVCSQPVVKKWRTWMYKTFSALFSRLCDLNIDHPIRRNLGSL